MTAPSAFKLSLAPNAYKAMVGVNAALEESTLGKRILNLVFLRVSQINGCGFCVDMHARDLLAMGEDLQRLNSVVAWREVTFFDERERAALHWAETVSDITHTHAPMAELERLRQHFDDKEIVELTYAVAQINAWNRLAIGLHVPVKRAALVPGKELADARS